jgi:hypothetical protein
LNTIFQALVRRLQEVSEGNGHSVRWQTLFYLQVQRVLTRRGWRMYLSTRRYLTVIPEWCMSRREAANEYFEQGERH